jgi:hypothetical protein
MANNSDWLPGKREQQLAMASNWIIVILNHGPSNPWNIPPAELTALQDMEKNARIILAKAQSSARTPVITVECREAFNALTSKMRFFKGHYFLVPPLTEADLASLGLSPRAPSSPVPDPVSQAEADITRPGVHLLELRLRQVSGSPPDPHRADHGFRIYWGVLPQGGAAVEAALGAKRELVKAPVSGKELPHSLFTRRKKELFDFDQEDSGKTVYFCVRYENAKGRPGPWGPLFSAVIP